MGNFPNSVDQFINKLDKRDTPYIIQDEILNLVEGVGEKELEHDNIDKNSLEIWSNTGKRGTKVNSFILQEVKDAPWKCSIKVMCEFETVYITYESDGDQVEAADINVLQKSICETQNEILRHEKDNTLHVVNGVIDGGSFK